MIERLRLASCLLALLLASCARKSATPVDWAALEASGRVVDRPAGLNVLMKKGRYVWTDGTVPLQLVPVT